MKLNMTRPDAEIQGCPFSSDDCDPSADSDQDLITDYLLPEADVGGIVVSARHMAAPHGTGSGSGQGAGHLLLGPSPLLPGPLLPTISVTPHSPGGKHYAVLEDNLQHLHLIHESVQQMREQSAAVLRLGGGTLTSTKDTRRSSSCPALADPGSDPDLLSSATSSPVQAAIGPLWRGINTIADAEVARRRSWTALEDLTNGKSKRQAVRQRSASLSSMDSEPDEPALLNADGPPNSRSRGTASTHSLNEADLQSDFQKIQAKREAESRLLPVRQLLQKSISTPSIIAVRDMVGIDTQMDGTAQGNATETEEEEADPSMADASSHLSLHPFLTDATYDHHSEKRRKRSSLFFRKKKDKTKKNAHQWTVSNNITHPCEWCSKALTVKTAVTCENCCITVHQSSCKDHVQDCKGRSNKTSSKQIAPPPAPPKQKKSSLTGPPQNTASSQIINEEKESDGIHDNINYSDELPLVQFEFHDEGPVTAADLETDPIYGLNDDELDSWTPTVGKEVTKKMKEKEIKRQEHIYEFILTEKHHCLTLRVMQKVFVEGIQKHFQLGANLGRMFPRLDDLTKIHFALLAKLRARQRASPVVDTISDILLDQFSGESAAKLKAYYGEFCSHHRDAVDIYKYHLQHDRRFGEFMRHCQANPLLKKKGVPECILFVTQRLTKYPLLIEPLIKTSRDNKTEQERLVRVLALVKEILVEVDAQVAEKEKEDRKLEIYHRIDAKSFTGYRGNKFKKSDILADNRKLRFEGYAMLMQGRSKMHLVLVVVLTDVLLFLLDSNHKYSFFTPENKPGVVSLQKLLVREKAGQDSRGIYLISSNPKQPEMFELKVHKPKDKQAWIQAIRAAVQCCPEEDEDGALLSQEERQRLLDAKQTQIRQIVGVLRQKDMEQAVILEEKMLLQQQLAGASHLNTPSYQHLVTEEADSNQLWQEAVTAIREVNQLASSLYTPGTSLARSVSSVGEHQSSAYVSPTLPKRAETFGGFDNANKDQPNSAGKLIKKQQQSSRDPSAASSPTSTPDLDINRSARSSYHSSSADQIPWRPSLSPAVPNTLPNLPTVVIPAGAAPVPPSMLASTDLPALATLGPEQQIAALQLSHHVYTLCCIISQQMTTNDSLQAQLNACRSQLNSESESRERRPAYRQAQQLEELRNLQDRLTHEKEAWAKEKEDQEKELSERRSELTRLQEQVRAEQTDVTQQREQLFRKLEALSSQGILLSPSIPRDGSDAPPPPTPAPTPSPPVRKMDSAKWKQPVKTTALPINLISATNQQKVAQNVQIKQQLPLKLSSLGSGGGGSNSAGNSPGQASTTGVGGIQQMLPLKLCQSSAGGENRRSAGGTSSTSSSGGSSSSGTSSVAYQRLGSGSSSPPPAIGVLPVDGQPQPTVGPPAPSHARTGSSPAMMQSTGRTRAASSQDDEVIFF